MHLSVHNRVGHGTPALRIAASCDSSSSSKLTCELRLHGFTARA